MSKFYKEIKDTIESLEAKLAESEKSNKYFADRVEKADKEIKEIYKKYNKLVEEYNNLKEEVDNNFVDGQKHNQLKQQLAEKEKERHEEWKTGKEWKWEWQKVSRQLEQANQDKISFCIEKLEQVKKYAQHIQGGLINYIDNQIEQLKKEKK